MGSEMCIRDSKILRQSAQKRVLAAKKSRRKKVACGGQFRDDSFFEERFFRALIFKTIFHDLQHLYPGKRAPHAFERKRLFPRRQFPKIPRRLSETPPFFLAQTVIGKKLHLFRVF